MIVYTYTTQDSQPQVFCLCRTIVFLRHDASLIYALWDCIGVTIGLQLMTLSTLDFFAVLKQLGKIAQ